MGHSKINECVKAELFPNLLFIGFYSRQLVDFQEEV